MKNYVLLLMVCMGFAYAARAQSFTGTYPFTLVTTTSGTTDPTAVPTATGLTFGSFSAVGVATNPNATGRFSFTGWSIGATNGLNTFTGGIDLSKYYQVTALRYRYSSVCC